MYLKIPPLSFGKFKKVKLLNLSQKNKKFTAPITIPKFYRNSPVKWRWRTRRLFLIQMLTLWNSIQAVRASDTLNCHIQILKADLTSQKYRVTLRTYHVMNIRKFQNLAFKLAYQYYKKAIHNSKYLGSSNQNQD